MKQNKNVKIILPNKQINSFEKSISKKEITSQISGVSGSKINNNQKVKYSKNKVKNSLLNLDSNRKNTIMNIYDKIEKLALEDNIRFEDKISQSEINGTLNKSELVENEFQICNDSSDSDEVNLHSSNKNIRIVTESSNFLNYNLGETNNLTHYLENDSKVRENNKDQTILTINQNLVAKFTLNDDSSDSKSSSDTENFFGMTKHTRKENLNLSLSQITKRKISSSKNMSKHILRILKFSNKNISILSDSLSLYNEEENENYSNYCSDTEEFNEHIIREKSKNQVYKMKVNENFLKSHLDIPRLNFILRCLFHKSEILTQKIDENMNYTDLLNQLYQENIISDKDKTYLVPKRGNSGKSLANKDTFSAFKNMNKKKRACVYRSLSKQITQIRKFNQLSINSNFCIKDNSNFSRALTSKFYKK